MIAAGVDTWSVCWYLADGSKPAKAMEALATQRAARSLLIPEDVAGHRVGWFPGNRLMFAEGHPSDGLAVASELPRAVEAIAEELHDRGVLPPARRVRTIVGPQALRPTEGVGFAGVRRFDSTVDLSFEDPKEGLAVLTGVAALTVPRVATSVRRDAGSRRVETVYYHGYGGRRVLARFYDKGVEQAVSARERAAARGTWIRPEDQRRFGAMARPTLEAVSEPGYARALFVDRFQTLWKAAQGVTVAGVLDLARKLDQLQEDGVLSPAAAKRIAGHLVLDAVGAHRQSRSTVYQDAADAREMGLVLADGILDEVEVDLAAVLEASMDASSWGAQG